MPKELIPYIAPLIVFVLVAWRLYRNAKARPIEPRMLWIRPAILLVFLGLAFLHPPALTPLTLAVLAAAALAGLALGYVLASHQTLTIDSPSGKITSKMSPVGSVLFLGLFVLRFGLRTAMDGGDPAQSFTHQSPMLLLFADAGLVFVLGLVAAQAWETWLRAKPLLEGHAGQKAGETAN